MKEVKMISSVEIMNTPMQKQRFIVDGVLYPGLHILSGDPKTGKSWMMMDLCLSVAKGEKFLGRKTEQGHVVYMALEDTFVSLQTRMYELTDEPTDNLQYVLTANTLGDGLENDLRVCKKQFDDLKLIVIDTLQKIRGAADSKYSTDYHDLSALKQIADELEIAIVAVHHNRKMHDANPNHMIAGTTGLTGCADGLLVLLKKPNEHTALLHISGRGAPQLELHLVREDAKWRLLDDAPPDKPDLFPFAIHDFIMERGEYRSSASELCERLHIRFPNQEFKNNRLYRDLLQHDIEVRNLGVDYRKYKSNGQRLIELRYGADRDSSGGSYVCAEVIAPADPDNHEKNVSAWKRSADNAGDDDESSDPTVPAAPERCDHLIAFMARRLQEQLAQQGVQVKPFSP